MHNGLLCKYADSAFLIVVPKEMQMGIIVKAHQQGHFKHQKLATIITKDFFSLLAVVVLPTQMQMLLINISSRASFYFSLFFEILSIDINNSTLHPSFIYFIYLKDYILFTRKTITFRFVDKSINKIEISETANCASHFFIYHNL